MVYTYITCRGQFVITHSQSSYQGNVVLSERSALFISMWMSGKDGGKPFGQECISTIYIFDLNEECSV